MNKKIVGLLTSIFIINSGMVVFDAAATENFEVAPTVIGTSNTIETEIKTEETEEIDEIELIINKNESILELVLTIIDYPINTEEWTDEQINNWENKYKSIFSTLVETNRNFTTDELYNIFVTLIDYPMEKNEWTDEQRDNWNDKYASLYSDFLNYFIEPITTSISETYETEITTISTENIVTTEENSTTIESWAETTISTIAIPTIETTTIVSEDTNIGSVTESATETTNNEINSITTSLSTTNNNPKTGDKGIKKWTAGFIAAIIILGLCAMRIISKEDN